MNILPAFLFEYAIRFPDGQYYLGGTSHFELHKTGRRVFSHRTNNSSNRGSVLDAYTYTERAAHGIVAKEQPAFEGCTVVKIL